MLSILKKSAPNLYILIVAIAISLWFEGINVIISHILKEKTIYTGVSLCFIALAVFYLDDGSLNELYNPSSSAQAAAAVSSKSGEV